MRLLLVAIAALLLSGFPGCNVRDTAPTADAPAMCYVACTPSLTDTGIRWTGSADSAHTWDELGQSGGVIPLLSGALLTCEARRQSCAGFITDLKHRNVIKATP